MRAVVLTSTSRRHDFLAHTIASRIEVAGVWREAKEFAPITAASTPADREVLARHLDARDASEEHYFGRTPELASTGARVRDVPPAGCNDAAEVDAMRRLDPDVVVVFGTAVLRRGVLDAFSGRLINLHLGLSPYYRGSGTNFWPLVNREPEFVGATIHYLDSGIDSGPIITQVRAPIERGDGPHDVGNRTIAAAAAMLAGVAAAHALAPLAAVPQDHSRGRLYRRQAFNADAVRQMLANFAGGMIDEYLAARAERDARAPIIRAALDRP